MKYGKRERISGIIIVIALLIIFIPFLISDPESEEARPEPSLSVEQPAEVPRQDLQDPTPSQRLDDGEAQEQASESSSGKAPVKKGPAFSEDRSVEDPIARLAEEAEQRQISSARKIPATPVAPNQSVDQSSTTQSSASTTTTKSSATKSSAAPQPATKSSATASRSGSGSSATNATPGGEWAVQVGSFGKPSNASGLEKRLNEKGYPAYRRERDNNLTSVYVGPYDASGTAESVMAKLKAELNQQGLLVRTSQIK